MIAQKRMAYVAVIYDDGYRLGIAKEGEAGYYQLKPDSDLYPKFETFKEACNLANEMNERLGHNVDAVAEIVSSTMRSGR